MRRLKIGFDFDSVITDSRALKTEHARRMYGIDIPYEDFKWHPAVTGGLITPEQYRAVQVAVHEGERYRSRMLPVDEVLTYLPQLAQRHDVTIITARSERSLETAKRWLAEHVPDIPIIGVGHGGNKAPAATGMDLFVDDDRSNLDDLAGTVPNLYLFSWKFNEHERLPARIGRVSSWKDIDSIVTALEAKYD
jgi:5'(3')-deoxyribonucleotidase